MKDVIIMTREEKIKESAEKRTLEIFGELDDFQDRTNGFIEGAKWADEHPSVDTVKKIICYALRFTNIMLADKLEEGEWELLIKKAMEE